jgi:hypothetical protein
MTPNRLLSFVICCSLCSLVRAGDAPQVLATGEWSKPVADSRGYAIRGRLVICEKPRRENLRETPIYVELQEASDFIGAGLKLFCEMGSYGAQPGPKGGLNCELRDSNNQLVPSTSFPFGGGVPKSEWVSLPTDATIRLRATPFGMRRADAISLCPYLGAEWIIPDTDQNEYFLSGTFTVDPSSIPAEFEKDHVWRGTLQLPAVRIVNRPK